LFDGTPFLLVVKKGDITFKVDNVNNDTDEAKTVLWGILY
jgi:hypothetical protein